MIAMDRIDAPANLARGALGYERVAHEAGHAVPRSSPEHSIAILVKGGDDVLVSFRSAFVIRPRLGAAVIISLLLAVARVKQTNPAIPNPLTAAILKDWLDQVQIGGSGMAVHGNDLRNGTEKPVLGC